MSNINNVKGVVTAPYDIRDYTIQPDNDFPVQFQCPVIVPVKNQGWQSTCTAHAAASVVEYHHKRQHNEYLPISTEFIYGYREDNYYKGEGMVIRDALKTLQKYGAPAESDCPGNHNYEKAAEKVNVNIEKYKELAYLNRISSYYRCNSPEEIKTALMKHGPVLISMNTHKGEKIKDDIYTYDPEKYRGRHCVMVYGWNNKGWLIQNSWGLLYAGDGRFILPYNFKINEAWGITDDITDIKVKKSNQFLNVIYKAYNYIINLFLKITNRTK